MLNRILAALAALVLLCAISAPARAGWEYCVPASAIQIGGNANFFGTATRSAGDVPYVAFDAASNQTASFEFHIPEFLSSTLINFKIWGRVNSVTVSDNIFWTGFVTVATEGVDVMSAYVGSGGSTLSGTVAHPNASNNVIISTTKSPVVTAENGFTGAACASVAACAGWPSRFRFQRIVSGSSDSPVPFEVESVCLYGNF